MENICKQTYLIGIDTGTHTGIAVWELHSQKLLLVDTMSITKDKRESPRLQSWDESASMFFLILDISDYGISRNTSDRLAEIRTRPQRRQTGAQLCKFLTQNSR